MNKLLILVFSGLLLSQNAQVQIIHNSPYPTVDIHVNGSLAVEDVEYRDNLGMVDLPVNTVVGIAPANGEVIAEFPFTLEANGNYVVVASGILDNASHPFGLLASGLELEAEDENSFALKVMHGVTDAPAVDIYANGSLLVSDLSYGEYQGYLQVPAGDYTIDITAHGSTESVAAFSAPLSGFGGGTGVVYASGFLGSTNPDSVFTLVLATPSGYSVELPSAESELDIEEILISPITFHVGQNFPNPFNPATTISYNISENSLVKINVYDLIGNKIVELFKGNKNAGIHNISWNAKNALGQDVPGGMYLLKVEAGNLSETRKMILLK